MDEQSDLDFDWVSVIIAVVGTLAILWLLFGYGILQVPEAKEPEIVIFNITVLDKGELFGGHGIIETDIGTMHTDNRVIYGEMAIGNSYTVYTENGTWSHIIKKYVLIVDKEDVNGR